MLENNIQGTLVIMALAFLTPAFVFIPSATLGAVIIMAASQMFDWDGIGKLGAEQRFV